jgi:hypothetical protein
MLVDIPLLETILLLAMTDVVTETEIEVVTDGVHVRPDIEAQGLLVVMAK